MSGTIDGYTGPEGGGKSLLCSHYLWKYYKAGGRVLCFPGYEILDKGKVISTLLMPEDWVSLPPSLNNVAIGIDEIDKFINSYNYSAVIAQMFNHVASQRRKRNLSILFSVQDFSWLPPRVRFATHTITTCWDMWFNFRNSSKKNPIEKGTMIKCQQFDLKGLYTGRPGWAGPQKIYHGKGDWDKFDTNAVVDPREGFVKVNIHRREIEIGHPDLDKPEGYEMGEDERGNVQAFAGSMQIPQYEAYTKELINGLREQGLEEIPSTKLFDALKTMGVPGDNRAYGRLIRQQGMRLKPRRTGDVYAFNKDEEGQSS